LRNESAWLPWVFSGPESEERLRFYVDERLSSTIIFSATRTHRLFPMKNHLKNARIVPRPFGPGNTRCGHLYEMTRKEKQKAYDAKRYIKQREKIIAYSREYRAKNHEAVLATVAKYRIENKEKISAYRKVYNAENKESVAAYNAKYHAEHLEQRAIRLKQTEARRRERSIEYRRENADRIAKYELSRAQAKKEYAAIYFRLNREKHAGYGGARRARINGNTTGDPKIIALWTKAIRAKPLVNCYWCLEPMSGKKVHIDHIIPVVKDGPHEIGNLCASCKRCNSRKRSKDLSRWSAELEQPVLF
jgi:5-methylcytosine-specific restriction endonuclease McrA